MVSFQLTKTYVHTVRPNAAKTSWLDLCIVLRTYVACSIILFSHGPTYVKWVEPGSSASVSHVVNLCVRVASYSAKRWLLESESWREQKVHINAYIWLRTWLGKCVIVVTEQRMRGYGCFFSSLSGNGCLLRICSEEPSGWGTGAVNFEMKLLRIGVRGKQSTICS